MSLRKGELMPCKAVFNSVMLCHDTGVHSQRLLPFTPQLKAHLKTLEGQSTPTFSKPPHLPSHARGLKVVEKECRLRIKNTAGHMPDHWNDWRAKIEVGYYRLVDTLYEVAGEFDVRGSYCFCDYYHGHFDYAVVIIKGYGLLVKNKLENKWCCTDCLGDMCEKAVREEETSGKRAGKEREWDGRGSGETEKEDDIWQHNLDFVAHSNRTLPGDDGDEDEDDNPLTIGELMHLRYFKAEREKELVSIHVSPSYAYLYPLACRAMLHSSRTTISVP
jgi:RNA polymerase II-associated protein 3